MFVCSSVKIKERTLNIRDGYSIQARFLVTTWWICGIPVLSTEMLLTVEGMS